jgi:hypothetical protein
MSPGEDFRLVPLLVILPQVAAEGDATIEFVAGEAENRLNSEFGGMAGVKRW